MLDRLLSLNPWLSELHGRQAHMLGQSGRLDEAVAAAERAVALNPTLRQVLGWLAEAHRYRGDEDKAGHFQRLYDRTPVDLN